MIDIPDHDQRLERDYQNDQDRRFAEEVEDAEYEPEDDSEDEENNV